MASISNPGQYDAAAFERSVAPVIQLLGAEFVESVSRYQAPAALRDRIDELAAKSNEGELTDAERSELEGYVRANKFIATLQASARKLQPPSGSKS
jgi:hypothetical protein